MNNKSTLCAIARRKNRDGIVIWHVGAEKQSIKNPNYS